MLADGKGALVTELTVNGTRREIDAAPDTPLLWVLRDTLGLTGTKYGCGIGSCWACAVHLDGKAVPSCLVSLEDAAGKAVVTIEGLGAEGPHPVQEAWIAAQVPQCGYCQSGQIMTAAALLAATPDPSPDDVDAAMGRVLCRCATYNRIRQAIAVAAETMARPEATT